MKRAPAVFLLLLPLPARAGDPQAHTAAMVEAAHQVAQDPTYKDGVGAPNVPGPWPSFLIPQGTLGEERCTYDPNASFSTGCPYTDDNGRAINEPDDWSCQDARQPAAIRDLNQELAPFQNSVSSDLSIVAGSLKMTCNWNHFTSNPALPPGASAEATALTVEAWAHEMTDEITSGATCVYACTQDDWRRYYSRVVNGLHYLQDMQTERHALGNVDCDQNDVAPIWLPSLGLFHFAHADACHAFLLQTVNVDIGFNRPGSGAHCDDDVVQPADRTQINSSMLGMFTACMYFGASLSCMGLERTLRHHCALPGDGKSAAACAGIRSDHGLPDVAGRPPNPLYCEGERFANASGDFIAPATAISAAFLSSNLQAWAQACKQPDDPCNPDQCADWCKRSTPGTQTCLAVEPRTGECLAYGGDCAPRDRTTGYCVNDKPDPDCGDKHVCRCGSVDDCGGTGQPCCDGDSCKSADDTCAGQTGTCVPANSVTDCGGGEDGGPGDDEPDAGGPTADGYGWGDPHLATHDRTLYDFQRVGEFVFVRAGGGLEVQVRQAPFGGSKTIASIIAVAANVAGDVVEIDTGAAPVYWVNGAQAGPQRLPHGGTLDAGRITWPDGTTLTVGLHPTWMALRLFDARTSTFAGLLGDADGDPRNDFRLRDGTVLPKPLDKAAWTSYANAWRLAQAESLFHYGPGQDTATFTDLAFPASAATAGGLAASVYASARATCVAAGVSDPAVLDACILDVGTTGDASFAGDAALVLPPADAASSIYDFAVDPLSLKVDKVAVHALAADNRVDGVFVAHVQGPVGVLALASTNAEGAQAGGQYWDTRAGDATWFLAIEENGVILNRADSTIPPLGPGVHALRFYADSSGFFVAGQHFRLIATLPDGSTVLGPVLTY